MEAVDFRQSLQSYIRIIYRDPNDSREDLRGKTAFGRPRLPSPAWCHRRSTVLGVVWDTLLSPL